MSQHPLFPDPPVVTATVTVNVTQEHIDRADAEAVEPVAFALRDAFPDASFIEIIRDGAYAWTGNEVSLLRFDRDGTAFVSACGNPLEAVSPVTFQAEVIKP